MSDLNITLVATGGFTLVGGLVGGFPKSRPLPLSEPMLALLLLRRLPMMVPLGPWLAPLRSRLDVLFAGWFGPIGVAAIFYAVLASEKVGNDAVWWVGSLVVGASLLAHGATAAPFTLGYGRLARRGDDQEGDEA